MRASNSACRRNPRIGVFAPLFVAVVAAWLWLPSSLQAHAFAFTARSSGAGSFSGDPSGPLHHCAGTIVPPTTPLRLPASHCLHQPSAPLSAAARRSRIVRRSGASSSSIDKDGPAAQQQRLASLYRAGQYGTGGLGLVLLLMPDRTLTTLLPAKLGGAAGFGVAAGLCRILAGATESNRLSSDTYRRLNVGLLGFFLTGLCAVPGEAAFLPQAGPAVALTGLMALVRAYGAAVAWMGWKEGVVGGSTEGKGLTVLSTLQQMVVSLWKGTGETLWGILKVKNKKKAMTYRNSLLLVAACMFSSFMEGIFDIQFKDRFLRTWFEISLNWSAVGRLFLLATLLYTLKDAAERDRLTGTTFVQLHVLVGAWSGLVALGQSVYPLGFAPQRGVIMYALSLLFFTKAIKCQKEKEQEREERQRYSQGSS